MNLADRVIYYFIIPFSVIGLIVNYWRGNFGWRTIAGIAMVIMIIAVLKVMGHAWYGGAMPFTENKVSEHDPLGVRDEND